MLFFRIINKWVTEHQEFTLASASVLTQAPLANSFKSQGLFWPGDKAQCVSDVLHKHGFVFTTPED